MGRDLPCPKCGVWSYTYGVYGECKQGTNCIEKEPKVTYEQTKHAPKPNATTREAMADGNYNGPNGREWREAEYRDGQLRPKPEPAKWVPKVGEKVRVTQYGREVIVCGFGLNGKYAFYDTVSGAYGGCPVDALWPLPELTADAQPEPVKGKPEYEFIDKDGEVGWTSDVNPPGPKTGNVRSKEQGNIERAEIPWKAAYAAEPAKAAAVCTCVSQPVPSPRPPWGHSVRCPCYAPEPELTRASIDDATPAEWDAASKQEYARRDAQPAPFAVGERVEWVGCGNESEAVEILGLDPRSGDAWLYNPRTKQRFSDPQSTLLRPPAKRVVKQTEYEDRNGLRAWFVDELTRPPYLIAHNWTPTGRTHSYEADDE